MFTLESVCTGDISLNCYGVYHLIHTILKLPIKTSLFHLFCHLFIQMSLSTSKHKCFLALTMISMMHNHWEGNMVWTVCVPLTYGIITENNSGGEADNKIAFTVTTLTDLASDFCTAQTINHAFRNPTLTVLGTISAQPHTLYYYIHASLSYLPCSKNRVCITKCIISVHVWGCVEILPSIVAKKHWALG